MSLLHSPKIVTNGLVLCLDAASRKSYPGTGNVWRDLSGNGNDGTLTNGPTFSSANGGSIVLDGTDDYVISANNTQISGNVPRSLSVWFRSSESVLDRYYSVTKIGTGPTQGGLFEILINNNLVFGHFYGGGYALNVDSGKTLLNNFTNCVLTYLSPNVYIYIDGIYKGTINLTLNTINTKLDMGIVGYNVFYPFKGLIGNTLLYNRALNSQEVQQNFNALRGRYGI
jgi:hypothetical protein